VWSALLRIPYLKSARDSGHWNDGQPRKRWRLAVRRHIVRHYVANSEGVRRYLEAREGVAKDRIGVIPNGMFDLEPTGELARGELGLSDDDFVLASVAWLRAHKHIGFLIEALPSLLARGGRIKLLIVGDGPELARLEELARQAGVAEACLFLGRRSDVLALYRISDVAVSASPREGMSSSSIEALMMGRPVIACAEAGGNDDIVIHGEDGFLYPHGDRSLYAEAVLRLAGSEVLLSEMKRAARSRFLSEFAMGVHMARHLELYRGYRGWRLF
jgi:glycosyltransferase involved in cell wall biosynthesis